MGTIRAQKRPVRAYYSHGDKQAEIAIKLQTPKCYYTGSPEDIYGQ
jgi:hypothetical protein